VRPVDQLVQWLDQGAAALRGGDRQRAQALLQQATQGAAALAVAEQAAAWAGVAALARALGDPAAAGHAATALQAAQKGGRGAETAVARLRALLVAGRTDEALRVVDSVAANSAWRSEACTLAAHAALDLELAGQPQLGLDVLQRWQTADPQCVEAALAASRLARRAGIGAAVLGQLEAAVRRHPQHVPLAIHLAHLYKDLKRYSEALTIVDRLDFKGVTLDKALVLDITRVYLDAVDNQASLALQRRRADAQPPDVVAAFIVGTILHHTGHWQESNAYLARSQQAFASEPRQFIYTAMNHFRLGHQAEGERLIEEALRLGSSDPDIYYCRAVIWSIKDPRKAAADLQTYLKMTAGSHETYAPKEAKVERMLGDLRGCEDAKDVAECLQTASTLHTLRDRLPWLAGGLMALAGAAWAWRRRKRLPVATAAIVAAVVACGLHAVTAQAQPPTPGGVSPPSAVSQSETQPAARRATLHGLLDAPPPPWTDGWAQGPMHLEADRLVVYLLHPHQGEVAVLLLPRGVLDQPWARTASYDIGPATDKPLTEAARQQVRVLGEWLARYDHGQYPLRSPLAATTDLAGANRAAGDVRPTLATPTSWAAQWTWLDGLGRLQLLAGLVLLGLSGFFLPRWPVPSVKH
jgi:tetratricopeptide (TPR) repeat protein